MSVVSAKNCTVAGALLLASTGLFAGMRYIVKTSQLHAAGIASTPFLVAGLAAGVAHHIRSNSAEKRAAQIINELFDKKKFGCRISQGEVVFLYRAGDIETPFASFATKRLADNDLSGLYGEIEGHLVRHNRPLAAEERIKRVLRTEELSHLTLQMGAQKVAIYSGSRLCIELKFKAVLEADIAQLRSRCIIASRLIAVQPTGDTRLHFRYKEGKVDLAVGNPQALPSIFRTIPEAEFFALSLEALQEIVKAGLKRR